MRRELRVGSETVPAGDPRGGYFLIDVVAALALTALLMLMVFPLQPLATTPVRLRALLADTVTLLRDARTAAALAGRSVAVTFDAGDRTLRAGARVVAIPGDVGFGLTAGGNCPSRDARTGIVFRADGTNCGGTLRFVGAGRSWRAGVNWADGHVDVAADE